MELEQRGVPTVLVHTEAFKTLAQTSLAYRDFDYVPMYELPRLMDNMNDEEVQHLAEEVAAGIVAKLLAESAEPGSQES